MRLTVHAGAMAAGIFLMAAALFVPLPESNCALALADIIADQRQAGVVWTGGRTDPRQPKAARWMTQDPDAGRLLERMEQECRTLLEEIEEEKNGWNP